MFAGGHAAALLKGDATAEDLDAVTTRLTGAIEAVATATSVRGVDPATLATTAVVRARDAFATPDPRMDAMDRAALLGWIVLAPLGELAPGADPAATSAAWFDELRLASVLASGLRSAGLAESAAWGATDKVRTLLRLPRSAPGPARGTAARRDARLLASWLADPAIRSALGVNTWQGVEWVSGDRLAEVADWVVRLDAIEGRPTDPRLPDRLAARAAAAEFRVDRLIVPPSTKPRSRPPATSR